MCEIKNKSNRNQIDIYEIKQKSYGNQIETRESHRNQTRNKGNQI